MKARLRTGLIRSQRFVASRRLQFGIRLFQFAVSLVERLQPAGFPPAVAWPHVWTVPWGTVRMLEAIWHMIGSDLTVGLRPRVGY